MMDITKDRLQIRSQNGGQPGMSSQSGIAHQQTGVAAAPYAHQGYMVPQTGLPPQVFPQPGYPDHVWGGGGALREVGGLVRAGQVDGFNVEIEAWLAFQVNSYKTRATAAMLVQVLEANSQMDYARQSYVLSEQAQKVALLAYDTASAKLLTGMNQSLDGLYRRLDEIAARHLTDRGFNRKGFVFEALDWLLGLDRL